MARRKRNALIQVRMTPEEKRDAQKAADRLHYLSLTAFVLDAIRMLSRAKP